MLTDQEKALVEKLGDVFNDFTKLPRQHPCDVGEFTQGVHRLQDMVASRPAYRALSLERRAKQAKNGG